MIPVLLGKYKELQAEVTANKLPAVTSTDNGKVLSVVSGSWAAAEPGTGGEGLIVGLTMTTDDNDEDLCIYTMDKTADEILAACAAGQNVYIEWPGDQNSYAFYPIKSAKYFNDLGETILLTFNVGTIDSDDIIFSASELNTYPSYTENVGDGGDGGVFSPDAVYQVETDQGECDTIADNMMTAYHTYGLTIDHKLVIEAHVDISGFSFTVLDTTGGTVAPLVYTAVNYDDYPTLVT